MSARYTAEMGRLIGDPTETLVAETVYVLARRNDNRLLSGLLVANELVTTDRANDIAHAHWLIGDALAKKEIHLLAHDDLLVDEEYHDVAAITIDDIAELRMLRRKLYWQMDEANIRVPAHLPNETTIARAAIVHWIDEMEEQPGTQDLLRTIAEVSGMKPDFAPVHVLLNSLDAGAVRIAPEWEEGPQWFGATMHRWYLTEWTQR